MKKIILLIAGLLSGQIFADDKVHREIYQPNNAQIIELEKDNDGDIQVTFKVTGTTVKKLLDKVKRHGRNMNYKIKSIEHDREDKQAEIELARNSRSMDIEIYEENNVIIYKVDLDIH